MPAKPCMQRPATHAAPSPARAYEGTVGRPLKNGDVVNTDDEIAAKARVSAAPPKRFPKKPIPFISS